MKNILKKLFKIKSVMGKVSKDSDNPFFSSKYADLNAHLQLIEPLLQENGLVLIQPVEVDSNGVNKVSTRILDVESGEEVISSMALILNKSTMQEVGSAVSYARRYTLGSLLGMQAVDDDAEASMGRTSSQGNAGFPKKQWNKPQAKTVPQEEVAPKQSASSLKEEPKPFTREMAKSKPEAKEAPKSESKPSKGVVW